MTSCEFFFMFFFSIRPTNPYQETHSMLNEKKGDALIESGGHPVFLTSLFGLFFVLVHVVNSFVNSEICLHKNFKNKRNVV